MKLNTSTNFYREGKTRFRAYQNGDDFYSALIDMHRDLDEEQSAMVNAKLILLLSNHIGDLDVLEAAMDIARNGAKTDPEN